MKNRIAQYGIAILSVAMSIVLRRLLNPLIGTQIPYPTVLFAILVTAWYGGFRPAIFAVVIGALAVSYFLIPPLGVFLPIGAEQQVGMALFAFAGVGIALLGGSMHRARAQAEAAVARLEERVLHDTEKLAQVRDRLEESELRSRQIVESVSTHAIYALDLNGVVTSWTPGAKLIKGYADDEIIGQHFSSFYVPEDIAAGKPEQQLQTALREGRVEVEGRRIRKDGSEFWAAVTITPLIGENHEPIGFVKVARDVTERVASEQLLRARQEELEEAQRLAHIGNWYWDVASETTTGSDEFHRIFGYDAAIQTMPEFVAQRGKRYPAAEWDRLRAAITRAAETGIGYSLDLQAFRGTEPIWITIRSEAVRDATGKVVGLRGTLQDITPRRHAENALRVERDRIANIVSTVPVIICAFRRRADGTFSFPFASPGIEELFGETTSALERDASPFFERVHADDRQRVYDAIDSSANTMQTYRCEFRILHPQRGELWLEGHALPKREDDGAMLWQGYMADITERKRSDDALKHREHLLGIVTGTARVGLVVVGADYQYLFANEAYADIFGLESARIVGAKVPEVLRDGWEQIRPQLDRALAGEQVAYELTMPAVNGREAVRYYSVVYEPTVSETGERSVVVVVVDVTERRSAENASRESEQRLRFAQQVAQIGTFERHVDSDVSIWTPELERLYGLVPDGKPKTRDDIARLIHPDDRAAAFERIDHAFTTGLPTDAEWRVTWPDGSIHWIAARFQVVADDTGKPVRFTGVNIDVTEQRRAEAATREHRQRLEGIVSSAMDGIITVDETQRIVLMNAAAERMFECTAAEVMGHPIDRFIPPHLRAVHVDHIRTFGHTGHSARRMGRLGPVSGVRADGTEFPIDASISKVEVDGHTLYTVICRDVTQRVQAEAAHKSLEAQLRQSQKMDAFGQLAGGVAHDFNNLLTVITGCSELLLLSPTLDDDSAAMLSEIRDAGERASTLTRQLLAFSRQQLLEPKVVDLNRVIGDVERMLRRLIGEDVHLTTVLRPGVNAVKVDPGQIEQVVINLAVNARDAMPRGGRLTIETSNIELDETYTTAHAEVQPGRYVKLSMTDSGSGMPADVKARLFEPFFTTKGVGKGTGLGLAVVHGIIKQSGGSISVYSELNIGTTFSVYLPAVDSSVDDAVRDIRMHVPSGTETILLVEDETGVRGLAARVLQTCGYQLLTAPSGDEAQRVAAEWPLKIDLLLTDVVMPGLSGLQASELLRASRPDLKVLFMSGYTEDAIARHGVLQAHVAYLQKPFTPSALARKVREVLDAPLRKPR